MLSLILQKLRKVRPTLLSLVLFALASFRALTSGEAIQLVGICAAVVPFFCQFKRFPEADSKTSALRDVISSYLLNLLLMAAYLGWVLLLSAIGRRFVPSYIPNPYFVDMLFIAIAADVVFISAVIPVCRGLKPMQRMIPGLVLTNALLIFMMMASEFVKVTTLTNLPLLCCGFCGLVMALALGMMFAGYRDE